MAILRLKLGFFFKLLTIINYAECIELVCWNLHDLPRIISISIKLTTSSRLDISVEGKEAVNSRASFFIFNIVFAGTLVDDPELKPGGQINTLILLIKFF